MSFFSDEDILDSVHRYRPKFLSTSNGLPSYYDPYEFEHICLLTCQQPNEDTDALTTDDKHLEPSSETMKCVAVPFVAPNNFQNNDVAKKLATIIKQVLSSAYLLCIFLHMIIPLLLTFCRYESSIQKIYLVIRI